MEELEIGSIVKMVSPEGRIKLGLIMEVQDDTIRVLDEWYEVENYSITVLGKENLPL